MESRYVGGSWEILLQQIGAMPPKDLCTWCIKRGKKRLACHQLKIGKSDGSIIPDPDSHICEQCHTDWKLHARLRAR